MWCKLCGATVIKGYSKVLRRHIRVCTRCGRVDFLDNRTGRLVVWQPIRYRRVAI